MSHRTEITQKAKAALRRGEQVCIIVPNQLEARRFMKAMRSVARELRIKNMSEVCQILMPDQPMQGRALYFTAKEFEARVHGLITDKNHQPKLGDHNDQQTESHGQGRPTGNAERAESARVDLSGAKSS